MIPRSATPSSSTTQQTTAASWPRQSTGRKHFETGRGSACGQSPLSRVRRQRAEGRRAQQSFFRAFGAYYDCNIGPGQCSRRAFGATKYPLTSAFCLLPSYCESMDHAVALVQSYLQLNGYFTSAESPIISSTGRRGFRTITDIDVLAFRFPSGLDAAEPVPVRASAPRGIDISELDPGLGTLPNMIDMVIGEVKEGRVGINTSARDPEVLKTVIARLGQTGEEDQAVADLLRTGVARVGSGVLIRFIAFRGVPARGA